MRILKVLICSPIISVLLSPLVIPWSSLYLYINSDCGKTQKVNHNAKEVLLTEEVTVAGLLETFRKQEVCYKNHTCRSQHMDTHAHQWRIP